MVRADDFSLNLRGHYAGFVTRMLAFVLDLLIIVVSVFVSALVIQLTLSFLGILDLLRAIPLLANVESAPARETLFSIAGAFLINALVFDIYQVFFWMTVGKTPGKALVGIRVVPQFGEKLKLSRAIIRVLCYYLSGIIFFLGFLTVLTDANRQGWHDKIANTYVLYDWDARVGRRLLVKLGIEQPDLLDQPLSSDLQKQRQAYLQQQQSKPS